MLLSTSKPIILGTLFKMELSGQINEWLKRINVVSSYYTLCEFLKITELCKIVHDPQKK